MRISDWSSDVCSSDLALDAADVEAQAGQPTEAAMRFALDEVERARAPAHGLVQGVGLHRRRARRMPGLALEAQQHRTDPAMREHRFAVGRLGDDHARKTVLTLEEGFDAARIVGLLVAARSEEHTSTRLNSSH